jgi:hypothetical protein
MSAIVAGHHHDNGNFFYHGYLGVPWCAKISVIMPATWNRVRYVVVWAPPWSYGRALWSWRVAWCLSCGPRGCWSRAGVRHLCRRAALPDAGKTGGKVVGTPTMSLGVAGVVCATGPCAHDIGVPRVKCGPDHRISLRQARTERSETRRVKRHDVDPRRQIVRPEADLTNKGGGSFADPGGGRDNDPPPLR